MIKFNKTDEEIEQIYDTNYSKWYNNGGKKLFSIQLYELKREDAIYGNYGEGTTHLLCSFCDGIEFVCAISDVDSFISGLNLTAERLSREISKRNANATCRKCGGEMKPGVAIEQTATGIPDFGSADEVVTMSPGGTGKLINCEKCEKCGWSRY